MFIKRRKKNEYLEYKNGRIHSLGEKTDIPKDFEMISKENNDNLGYEKSSKAANKEGSNKKKLALIFMKILIFILLIISILFIFKFIKGNVEKINMSLDEMDISFTFKETKESENASEEENLAYLENNNKILEEKDIDELKKLLDQINYINSSLNSSYENTKNDILNYNNNLNGAKITKTYLQSRKALLVKNKELISNKIDNFELFNLEEIHTYIIKSYDSLINAIDSISLDLSKESSYKILNSSIIERNSYIDNINNLIRSYLTDNNIEFQEEEGIFYIE